VTRHARETCRSAVAALAAALVLGVGAATMATPASAHNNKSVVRLAVTAANAGTTVHAFLVYSGDRQPVADEYVLAEASSGGRSRGFQLLPSRKVPGEFASTVHLPDGHWELVVEPKAATVGHATGSFDLTGGTLRHVELSAEFDPADAAPPTASARALGTWAGVSLAAVALLLVVLLASRSRRARSGDRPVPHDRPESRGATAGLP
jgi:hypothetical protein